MHQSASVMPDGGVAPYMSDFSLLTASFALSRVLKTPHRSIGPRPSVKSAFCVTTTIFAMSSLLAGSVGREHTTEVVIPGPGRQSTVAHHERMGGTGVNLCHRPILQLLIVVTSLFEVVHELAPRD